MVRKKALAAKEAVKTEEVSAEAVKEAASVKKEAEAAEHVEMISEDVENMVPTETAHDNSENIQM